VNIKNCVIKFKSLKRNLVNKLEKQIQLFLKFKKNIKSLNLKEDKEQSFQICLIIFKINSLIWSCITRYYLF